MRNYAIRAAEAKMTRIFFSSISDQGMIFLCTKVLRFENVFFNIFIVILHWSLQWKSGNVWIKFSVNENNIFTKTLNM